MNTSDPTTPDVSLSHAPGLPTPSAQVLAELGVEQASPEDIAAIESQLGRLPRGVVGVASRCPCGHPNVVATMPRLPDGTPFPTTFYATCPTLTGAIGTLEANGVMAEMTERLGEDPELAAAYRAAYEDYLARRSRLGHVPEIEGIAAGGMPERVKCLHVLVGHSLSAGPGVNPFGDEAIDALKDMWPTGPCVPVAEDQQQ
ncbi:Protein of uncharacterised function (DUF501) [Dermatophilus congolensis]|uniref:Protein of uncharacterized function (DUF501) n=1 Tax=Dermatophilus congolensis TaxID=1863 RepID=A0AA46BNW9_9MICO|nr:Protein of uncharacterised function (DUF501) [Dermatophilus congolensis]